MHTDIFELLFVKVCKQTLNQLYFFRKIQIYMIHFGFHSHICEPEGGTLVFRNATRICSIQNYFTIINRLPKVVIWLALMIRVTLSLGNSQGWKFSETCWEKENLKNGGNHSLRLWSSNFSEHENALEGFKYTFLDPTSKSFFLSMSEIEPNNWHF